MNLLLVAAAGLVVWYGLRGSLGPSAFVAVGALVTVWLLRGGRSNLGLSSAMPRKLLAGLQILLLFAWELLLSNFQQLRIVLGPSRLVQPHWLSFATELESPTLRALLGTMISLTPGTMTVDIEEDGRVWVHVLVAENDEAVIKRIRWVLERPLRRLET